MTAMKMLWLLVSILVLHQAVAMERTKEPVKTMSELIRPVFGDKAKRVQCSATAYCPDGNTCCMLESGDWGCCPLPEAVCCPDRIHCCPHGSTCTSTSCQKGSHVTQLFKKKPAIQVKNVICPGGQYQCPDGNTCCKLSSGQWGCCPLPKAVCCPDLVHCCPHGTTCTSSGTCERGSHVTKLFKKKSAIQVNTAVKCPDGESSCPDGSTCCITEDGEWACCPLPDAVCCEDHEHCCPDGYTCDVSAGTCTRQNSESIEIFLNKPAIQEPKVKNVVCPDGQSECPDGNTCCILASGDWGCCPLPNAVCCSDDEHCCPHGYTCTSGQCHRGSHVTKLFKKKPAIQAKNVICPDGSECPAGNTCCMLPSSGYGCCPFRNAVCCSDGKHCCPEGYTCDVSQGTCTQRGQVTTLFLNKPPLKAKDVTCKGGQDVCPDGTTCCELKSGKYGCCPFPEAVCCSDDEHCCPQGYTCDVSAGTCSRHGHITDFFPNKPATQIPKSKNVVCPGGQAECPAGNTCCMLSSGEYGCCPLPNAVCCSDDEHCCPEGYTCDVSQGTCTQRGQITAVFLNKLASKAEPLKNK